MDKMNTKLCNSIHDAAFVMADSVNRNSLLISAISFILGVLSGFHFCNLMM